MKISISSESIPESFINDLTFAAESNDIIISKDEMATGAVIVQILISVTPSVAYIIGQYIGLLKKREETKQQKSITLKCKNGAELTITGELPNDIVAKFLKGCEKS